MSRQPDFASSVQAQQVSASPVTVTFTGVREPGTYYWRARVARLTASGSLTSEWSSVSTFTYAPPQAAQAILAVPAMVSPASDARVHGRPTFVVNNVVRPSTLPVGPLFYRFEVSTTNFSPQFDTNIIAASPDLPEGAGRTSWQPPANLPFGIRVWWRVRVTNVVSGQVIASAPSPFIVVLSTSNIYQLTVVIAGTCGNFGSFRFYMLGDAAAPANRLLLRSDPGALSSDLSLTAAGGRDRFPLRGDGQSRCDAARILRGCDTHRPGNRDRPTKRGRNAERDLRGQRGGPGAALSRHPGLDRRPRLDHGQRVPERRSGAHD